MPWKCRYCDRRAKNLVTYRKRLLTRVPIRRRVKETICNKCVYEVDLGDARDIRCFALPPCDCRSCRGKRMIYAGEWMYM